ncbi:45512_t:CDS:2 [Gigaspora margarita]|uniref:45512_t:CDS:1 n=1 Tax=Gigaspora margarita TaxID=4874 RepID=A0ABN7UIE9_GIGMA|nr:45512_t:CDS:2 [Gigaspora margarita]
MATHNVNAFLKTLNSNKYEENLNENDDDQKNSKDNQKVP